MKKFREFLSRPAVTIALLVLALALLAGSTIGGVRAALTEESDYFNTEVTTAQMGVLVYENGEEVEGSGALFTDLLSRAGDTKIKAGKKYSELLSAYNSGVTDAYIRAVVYKYWVDEQGNKYPHMDSKWIELEFGKDGWTIDKESSTEERTILYYSEILEPGAESDPFITGITINGAATRVVDSNETDENGVLTVTTTYVYNGKSFCVDVHIDAVQTHSASDAKISAWGVDK